MGWLIALAVILAVVDHVRRVREDRRLRKGWMPRHHWKP